MENCFGEIRRFPLDFSVHGTNLQMDYSFLRGRYDSHLSVGKVDTSFEDFRPFAWMTSADFSLGSTFIDLSSLTWTSGRSSFKSSGRISDFRNPHLVGNYEAQIDLEEAAAVARGTIFDRASLNSRAMANVRSTSLQPGEPLLCRISTGRMIRQQLGTPPFPATTRLMISN